MTNKTSRRKFIKRALAVLGVGGLTLWLTKNSILKWLVQSTNNEGLAMKTAPNLNDVCILTSAQQEGPFFISSPIRRNIVEDKKGKQMSFKMQVLQMPNCKPIENAIVEIWHCDAEGNYSGYPDGLSHNLWKTVMFLNNNSEKMGDNVKPKNETRFLRGAQQSDANGIVEFNTILPGWYEGRAPHIHFKIIANEKEQLTSQFYFKPEFCNEIYTTTEPYNKYGESPYTIYNDVGINEDITAVEGLLLAPKLTNGILETSVKIGIKSV